jgi:uncharacterized short protein YbdD (DUF466 family)
MLGRRAGRVPAKRVVADGRTDVTLTPSAARGRGPNPRRITQLLGALRKIAGMPDYAAHLEHLRRCHPGEPIPTERQFYEEFLRTRYTDGPTRCC